MPQDEGGGVWGAVGSPKHPRGLAAGLPLSLSDSASLCFHLFLFSPLSPCPLPCSHSCLLLSTWLSVLPLSPPHPFPSLPGLGPVLDKGQVMTGYYRWLQRAGGFVWLQSVATVAGSGKSPGEHHVLWVSHVLR